MDVATAPGPVAEAFAARQQAWEDEHLSPLAARSYPGRRPVPEPDCGLRSPLQRDRDRIVHSKAFRRLKHKTQVFVSPEGDHYRTRLTHTLEVTQISRTVARALALKPKVVLLDEPTSALDPELVGEVLGVIRDLAREGWTLVVVTHEIRFARDVADQVLFLDEGVVAERGGAEVLTEPQHERTQRFLSRMLDER